MKFILITFVVSKFVKRIDSKELHPENIEFISVTKELSKFNKSIKFIFST